MKALKFIFVIFLFYSLPVFAESVVNNQTGSGSSNSLNIIIETEQNVTVRNEGAIVNEIQIEEKTGGNEASGNTGGTVLTSAPVGIGGGRVETGDASLAVTIENTVNKTVATISGCCKEENLEPDIPPTDGKGGGVNPSPVDPGLGGGTEIVPSTGTLPSAGSDPFTFFSSILGIPLILLGLIRIAELKSHKTLA